MNSPQSSPPGDDHGCDAADLRRAVSKLDVYQYERLAYTEFPARPREQPLIKRIWSKMKSIRRGIFRQP